jgi:hypothetical protein
VYLTGDPIVASAYAVKRSRFYEDQPVVLAVDAEKLEGDLYYCGDFKIEALGLGCFPHRLVLTSEDGRVAPGECSRIEAVRRRVLVTPRETVCQKLAKFLRYTTEED